MLVDCRLTVETAGPSSRDGGARQYSGSGTRQWIRQDLDVDTARQVAVEAVRPGSIKTAGPGSGWLV